MEGADPAGQETLRKHFSDICESALDPTKLTIQLFAKNIISNIAREAANQPHTPNDKRLGDLLGQVMANGAPGAFQTFVEAVKKHGAHDWLVEKLKGTYREKGGVWSSGPTHVATQQATAVTDTSVSQPRPIDNDDESKPTELLPSTLGAGFLCPCGKCDLLKFLDHKCPNRESNVFPYLDKRGLKECEINTLEATLEEESMNIKLKFDVLVKETQRWVAKLEKPVFTPKELKRTRLLMDLNIDKLNDAQTFDDIFDALNHSYCWSWLHFDILESIISLLSDEKMTPEFQKYRNFLNDYCKRSLYECPSYIARTHHKLRVPLLMKLPEDVVDKTLSDLKKVEKKIALIIGVKDLVLLTYSKGCTCLIYSLPKAVAKKRFPLSPGQVKMLAKLGVSQCYLYHVKDENKASESTVRRKISAKDQEFNQRLTVGSGAAGAAGVIGVAGAAGGAATGAVIGSVVPVVGTAVGGVVGGIIGGVGGLGLGAIGAGIRYWRGNS